MLNKRLIATTALAVAVAIPSIAYGATTKTGGKPATKPAPTKTAAAPAAKATQEENLKNYKNLPDSTVVATVGDEKITKGDLMSILWDWYGPSALEYYINTRIVPQEMKRLGVKVSDAEVDEAIKKIPLGPGQTLESALLSTKTTMAQLRAGFVMKIGLQKIVEKQCEPTEADYATYMKASHILISAMPTSPNPTPEDTQKSMDAAKAKAEQVLAEIKAGKSFTDAAKEYSEDPGSKNSGGELGWFRKADMVGEFSDACAKLKPGEMSEPVKSPYGYHIILLEKTGKDATGADKVDIRNMIVESTINAKMQEVFKDIQSRTKIENKISPKVEAPKPAANGGPMTYPGGTRPAPKPAQKPVTNVPPTPGNTTSTKK